MDTLPFVAYAGLSISVLFTPGYCFLFVAFHLAHPADPIRSWFESGPVRWGLSLGLSISLIPILWELTTAIGARISPAITVGVCLLSLAVSLYLEVRLWLRRRADPQSGPVGIERWASLILGAVLVVTLATRYLAIHGLAFPAWVDSPHHALIIRLLEQARQVPESYEPFLPVSPFSYHFGFHTVAVSFGWLSGLGPIDNLLILGQILNGLTPLAIYAFGFLITRDARVGLVAAVISGLISIFPGYYVSWGRYTQLAGLLLLAPLVGLIGALFEGWKSSGRTPALGTQWVAGLIVSVFIAGLIFTHYRVLAFGFTFGLTCLIVYRLWAWRFWAFILALVVVLAGPWLWHLVEIWVAPRLADTASYLAPAGYNDFRWNYFTRPLEQVWWAAAGAGALVGLLRRERLSALLVVWMVLTTAALNVPGAGSWVVNNESWLISAFVPGSILAGRGVVWAFELSVRAGARLSAATDPWLLERGRLAALGVRHAPPIVLGAVCCWGVIIGARAQATIVNPTTVLAMPADRKALDWMRHNLPSDSVIALNSWNWQHHIWSGSDGGAWIWPELGLRTTMPPADYSLDPALNASINHWNQRWMSVVEPDALSTAAILGEVGATHVYFGVRPGGLSPDQFVGSSNFTLIYHDQGVYLFEVSPRWR